MMPISGSEQALHRNRRVSGATISDGAGTLAFASLGVVLALSAPLPASAQSRTQAPEPAQVAVVAADFSQAAYFPLVKERMGLFQENEILRSEEQFLINLPSIADVPGSTFRVLGSFGAVRFNSPSQISGDGKTITVRPNPALEQTFRIVRANRKIPVMSWYGVPDFLRGASGARGVPTDLGVYAGAVAELAADYAKGGTFVWEVLNESNLDQFLRSDDNIADYFRIFQATAPAVKAADPDVLIAGPSLSDEAEAGQFTQFTDKMAAARAAGAPLPIDYFSFHIYRNPSATEDKLGIVRNAVGADYNTVPFLITEYENFHPNDAYETKALREKMSGAVAFLDHARMLAEAPDVASVTWNRFMTTQPVAERANPGGLVSYEGEKRAIYNAMVLYGWLPTDRNPLTLTGLSGGLAGFAGSDPHNAGVLLWNHGTQNRQARIALSGLPEAIRKNGRLRIYRIDAQHASAADGAPGPMVVEREETIGKAGATIDVAVPSTGIVYVRLDDGSGKATERRTGLAGARYVRSWTWVPRVLEGRNFVASGDYGTFDPASWVLRTGNRTPDGAGIAGVTLDKAPARLWVRFRTRDAKPAAAPDAITALRVDYWSDGRWAKSVLVHGRVFDPARTAALPWGKGGATADAVVDKAAAIGNGAPFDLDLDAAAPPGWRTSQRRVLVTAWSQANGPDAQSVVTLGDTADD